MKNLPTRTGIEHFPKPEIVGDDQLVPLANGMQSRYINLDNAASTPSFQSVFDYLHRFLPYYSSVHRGAGFKSKISTELYDQSRRIIGDFIGVNLDENTVIFTKNTTEAINKLSFRLPLERDSVVLTTEMEHHSNDLPWRSKATTLHISVTPQGMLDLLDLKNKLKENKGKVALVCISGASNVTGIVQPIHYIAELAHSFGAKILVDAAQLLPHRAMDMKPDKDPGHIDFLVFSAHKMYAPFGTGVLVAPKEVFQDTEPEYSGGGTVSSVTLDDIRWAGLPDREEAGSPNVIGAVTLAKTISELQKMGMHNISNHEHELTEYALGELNSIDNVSIYGNLQADRVGVISFNIEGIHHAEVAAILSFEYGIAVRNGCFCAHPYVVSLLGLESEDIKRWQAETDSGNKAHMPGLVRVSFGCYNTKEDVDLFLRAIKNIAHLKSKSRYTLNMITGEYYPAMSINPSVKSFLETKELNY
ncbi:MAG: aminotransferase class V-fold PLP-dependent enzyme [Balneolaceae bacterium]